MTSPFNHPQRDPDFQLLTWKLWIVRINRHEWLTIYSTCEAHDAFVCVKGEILTWENMIDFLKELVDVSRKSSGTARLMSPESILDAEITLDRLGKGHLKLTFRPDHANQLHEFQFPVDQSYLPELIRSVEKLDKSSKQAGAVLSVSGG